jgi:hypothetical protein
MSSNSDKNEKAEQYSEEVETDEDWLTELDLTPAAEACSDAEVMAALDASDSDFLAPVSNPQDAEWLADFKALARKHRPFSTTQMFEILRALNAVDDSAVEAGTGR